MQPSGVGCLTSAVLSLRGLGAECCLPAAGSFCTASLSATLRGPDHCFHCRSTGRMQMQSSWLSSSPLRPAPPGLRGTPSPGQLLLRCTLPRFMFIIYSFMLRCTPLHVSSCLPCSKRPPWRAATSTRTSTRPLPVSSSHDEVGASAAASQQYCGRGAWTCPSRVLRGLGFRV